MIFVASYVVVIDCDDEPPAVNRLAELDDPEVVVDELSANRN